ncbi:hypothetical protein QWZ10_00240 [Paracoccus cavernae]|uniref:Helicase Lhr-like winged helix domain-containing protein n=1 Tax=Paracoccus cavernae TaxID=1571207 RepID=A0ABT8D1F8_9RHOB|nr:hypothetical protein [Paracoccus cavernae]
MAVARPTHRTALAHEYRDDHRSGNGQRPDRGRGGGALGEVEESFAATLVPGDTFLIGGKTVRYDRMHELTIEVTPQPARQPKIAAFSGQTFSTSLELSTRVFDIISTPKTWSRLPPPVRAWLDLQARISALPARDHLLCESFPIRAANIW